MSDHWGLGEWDLEGCETIDRGIQYFTVTKNNTVKATPINTNWIHCARRYQWPITNSFEPDRQTACHIPYQALCVHDTQTNRCGADSRSRYLWERARRGEGGGRASALAEMGNGHSGPSSSSSETALCTDMKWRKTKHKRRRTEAHRNVYRNRSIRSEISSYKDNRKLARNSPTPTHHWLSSDAHTIFGEMFMYKLVRFSHLFNTDLWLSTYPVVTQSYPWLLSVNDHIRVSMIKIELGLWVTPQNGFP